MPSMVSCFLIFTFLTRVQSDRILGGERTLDSVANGPNSNGGQGSTDPAINAINNECSNKFDSDKSCSTFRLCCDSACDRLGRTSQPTCGAMRNGQFRLRCTCGSVKSWSSWSSCGSCDPPKTSTTPTTIISTTAPKTPTTIISTTAPKIACGVPSFGVSGDRIIGGGDAGPFSWPWQISLEHKEDSGWNHKCGGSVIAASFIMTAAHCVLNRDADNIRVVLGLVDRTQRNTAVIKEVTKIIRHELYYHDPLSRYDKYDVAILQLSDPIIFSDRIKPVCIAQMDAPNGTSCFATGWGRVSSGRGSAGVYLKQVQLPIVDRKVCARASIVGENIDDSMICAGAPGKDTCGGDSGGPLVCKSADGAWEQQGITSWGAKACGETDNPGVFARVSHFISFIYSNTGL